MVTLEQPELEERHHDLITSIATDKKQLLELEDQILGLLNDAGSGVNVLEDEVSLRSQVRPYFCAMTTNAQCASALATVFLRAACLSLLNDCLPVSHETMYMTSLSLASS